MIAASLGHSTDGGPGRLGYIIPAATGTGGVYVFNERISYTVRGVDVSATTYTNGSGTGSVTRWKTANGLAVLTQTSSDVLTFTFYAPGSFSTSSPYAPNGGATPVRTMTVESLASGANPDNTKYSLGGKVTLSRPGRADQTRTMWWNNSTSVLNAYTSLSTGEVIVTASTVPGSPPVRDVDTTVTETFTDASGASKTLTRRTRDSVRSLKDGEEQVESHKLFLTNSTTGPSLTTTYDYFPDTADAINRRTLHRRTESSGAWTVYFQHVHDWEEGWREAITLHGWKDTAAPALANVDTWAEITTAQWDEGTLATYSVTDPRGRNAYEEEWLDYYLTGQSWDVTAGINELPAYPYVEAHIKPAGLSMVDTFDTYTYHVGWDSANPDSTAAESVAPELRHRPLNTYRFKSHSSATSSASVTAAINTANVISQTHYRYLSADAGTSEPGYGTPVTWTAAKALEITDVVSDVLHLPSPMTRTVTERATGRTVARERYMVTAVDATTKDPTALEVLEQEWTAVDDQGRPVAVTANGAVVESWSYPAEDTVEHQTRSGAVQVTKYTAAGRVIYSMRENVASVSFAGITGYSSAAQPSIFTEYTYTALTAGGSQDGLYKVATKTIARSGTTLASSAVLDAASQPWSRTVEASYDGAGRVVYSKDLSGMENAIAHPTDQAATPVTVRRLGNNPASGTILEETKTYLDGQFKERTGEAVVAEYADYYSDDGGFLRFSSPTSPASDGTIVITDSIGRAVYSSSKTPSGTSVPQSSSLFYTTWTYDNESRLISRNVPGAASSYYEVSSHSYSSPDHIAARALSSNNGAYETSDPNQSRTLTRYEKISGLWFTVQEDQFSLNGTTWTTAAWSRTALGPFTATGTWMDVNTWKLTALTQSFSGGATTQSRRYERASDGLALEQVILDNAIQQSQVSVCGRAAFLQTPRFEKTFAHSPLGDALEQPSATESTWPGLTVLTATGQVASITTPGSSEVKESYVYYTGNDVRAGRLYQKSVLHTGTTADTYYSYNARGQLTHQWGGGDYPVCYEYDSQGRMTKLHTWRTGTWTGGTWPTVANPSTTEWTYYSWMDQPKEKIYMAGATDVAGTTADDSARVKLRYVYHPNGSLSTREWQRTGAGTASSDTAGAGVTTAWVYDAVGRLTTVDYPASATATASLTPDVSFTYDGAGRVATRTDGAGTTTNTWTAWGQVSKESLVTSISGVTQVTAEVERTYDGSNRLDLLKAKWGTASGMTAPDVDHGYDGSGYLNSIASASRSVVPELASGSSRWGTLAFKNGASTLMTATRTLDSAGRTDYMAYTQGGTVYRTFDYTYDRDRVTQAVHDQGNTDGDEMAWVYGYDAKGQVTSADKRYATDGDVTGSAFLAGYQTDYTYDEAGNRLTKKEGGNTATTAGAGQRLHEYTANALNQYSLIDNLESGQTTQKIDITGKRAVGSGGGAEVIGITGVMTTVYQNDAGTGLHFSGQPSVTAPANATLLTDNIGTWLDVTVTKTVGGGSPVTINSGKQFIPHPEEHPTYDADGNIRSDSRWLYEWDAENRLTALTTRYTASGGTPGVRLSYRYDGLSRRICSLKETSTNGSTWTFAALETYLYDGWNLLMRVGHNSSGTATTRQTFVWGPDMASSSQAHTSWQEAGGIGGLLMVLDQNAAITTTGDNYFPLTDRMGNIFGYRSSDSGSAAALSAVFEHDAFGREMKSVGSAADKMPFRFSSKFTDNESGLVYYGYRYYDTAAGKWLNRDPLEEHGGTNVTRVSHNNPVGNVDVLGLWYTETIEYASSDYIKRYYGVRAFTGEMDGRRPVVATAKLAKDSKHEFRRAKMGGKCCASIKSLKRIDVKVKTILPNDNKLIAPEGMEDVKAHEERRRLIYRLGHQMFISDASTAGAAGKCGWICRNSYSEAETALSNWADKFQAKRIKDFNDWTDAEQLALGSQTKVEENAEGKVVRVIDNYLVQQPPNPVFTDPPCPEPNG